MFWRGRLTSTSSSEANSSALRLRPTISSTIASRSSARRRPGPCADCGRRWPPFAIARVTNDSRANGKRRLRRHVPRTHAVAEAGPTPRRPRAARRSSRPLRTAPSFPGASASRPWRLKRVRSASFRRAAMPCPSHAPQATDVAQAPWHDDGARHRERVGGIVPLSRYPSLQKSKRT
jgi:hypothetical protein